MSKEQVLDKGIRQKSTRVNSFIACSAFCPGPPNCDPMDSEKQWRVYKSSTMMARHAWRVDKVLSDPPFQNKLRVYTASDANWLKVDILVRNVILLPLQLYGIT